MRKLGVLIACLLAVGPAAAQSDEYQAEDSYSEAPADTGVADEYGATEDAGVAEDVALADDPGVAEGDELPADVADQTEAPADEYVAEPESGAPDAAAEGGEAPAGNSMSDLREQTADEPAESGSVASDDYASDSYGGDQAEEEDEPTQLDIGADYVWTTASFSNPGLKADFGGERFDSNMYRVRAGMRLFEKMGLEVHYGTGNTDEEDLEADEYSTEQFYGVYLVPTGVLFNVLEVGAAIGYAHTELARPGASEDLDGRCSPARRWRCASAVAVRSTARRTRRASTAITPACASISRSDARPVAAIRAASAALMRSEGRSGQTVGDRYNAPPAPKWRNR